MFTKPLFPKFKSIVSEFPVSTAASTGNAKIVTTVARLPVMIQCTTGTIYVTTLTTAPTSINAWRVDDNDEPLKLFVDQDYLALYSTSTGMLAQIATLDY